MDAIFKSLNDPVRRRILDLLRQKDGMTLADLEAQFPEMTRFGVMKHLRVLEEAGLVIPRRAGRFKHHHLNALPLQEVIDRWIEPLLAKPAARALIDLKTDLERDSKMDTETMTKPDFVMQTYIRCSRDDLWEALTDPVRMAQYHFLTRDIRREGDAHVYAFPDGRPMLRCREIEVEPKSRIVSTFEPQWEGGGAPSRSVFLIAEEGDVCSLTLEHYDLSFPVVAGEGVADGWSRWASSLKTWLETGQSPRFSPPGMGLGAQPASGEGAA